MNVNWRAIPPANNSLAVLSAACEGNGYPLEITDEPLPDITCYSLNSINERFYRDEIAGADCITIVGGPHASACYREVAEYADYVVVGEGEYTLPALLAAIEEGRDPPPGVATAAGYTPARHTVLLDGYPPFSEIKGFIEITRGCPFSCGYCQTPRLFGRCMRHRSVDEIARYAARFRDIRFVSPNAFAYGSDGIHPRLDKVERLLKSLDGRIYFGTFPGEVRPECVTRQSVELILDHCANTRLHFGAQSGSDAVLRRLHRGHTVEDVIRAVDLCREQGLVPVVDVILGLPFEGDDDQRATLELVKLVARAGKAHIHSFMPLPGTPLANSRPRGLLPETEKVLGKLALGGRITGSWMDHEIRFFRRTPHL
ncbi:MAG: Radical SAM domain protein [Methanoculleus marisnigri]|jgi:B12-binding domain/radical SAM domain protein, MJ_1487 family|uniref:Radical SAM domain protein n=1 Tax=Methanoculleus marisnigri TaxID=2198 RepID=A0A101GSF9_9EURY|nr:TIGR04013 family B12-binding domain/radical SAM domain-containing protein [Methanoculleus marisnigri]KUK63636.1 MAG: Radical SAM domain protein [Methanoculleus marisnigri]KUL05534.1 MAG: Radical SAM domain protein [Methanoculleus marisnigri]